MNRLFLSQETWVYDQNPETSLCNIAKLSGMEKKEFEQCINNKDLRNNIYSASFEASKVLKINATPVFFLNGDRIDGAMDYEVLASKIDARMKLYSAADKDKSMKNK